MPQNMMEYDFATLLTLCTCTNKKFNVNFLPFGENVSPGNNSGFASRTSYFISTYSDVPRKWDLSWIGLKKASNLHSQTQYSGVPPVRNV